jgi:dynein heavy chain 1
MNPPTEMTRKHLYQELSDWIGVIITLPKIQSQRYQVGLDIDEDGTQTTYRLLLTKLPDYDTVSDAYNSIEDLIKNVEGYCGNWLKYQSLWNLHIDDVNNKMKKNLGGWMLLLSDIRNDRKIFDTEESKKIIGPITLDYSLIQTKVNLKYDAIQKSITASFGQELASQTTDFFNVFQRQEQSLNSNLLKLPLLLKLSLSSHMYKV